MKIVVAVLRFKRYEIPRMNKLHLLLLACLWLMAGCASPDRAGKIPADERVNLDFLADHQTTKEEVIRMLGAPSRTLENERFLCYRLRRRGSGNYSVIENAGSWKSVHSSLVLVFNERGVLERHAMVNIR